eukprot:304062-Chlamydomonas_euryale.AAC.10
MDNDIKHVTGQGIISVTRSTLFMQVLALLATQDPGAQLIDACAQCHNMVNCVQLFINPEVMYQ